MRIRRLTRQLASGLGRQRSAPVSTSMVAACVALFVVLAVLDLLHLADRRHAMAVLGLSYYGLLGRRWFFQLITAPLVHANLTHLIFNMLALAVLGSDVERAMGTRRYVLFSMFCAACGWTGFLLVDGGRGAIVFGYSGIVFGILMAQTMYFPDRMIYVYAFFPIRMRYAMLTLGLAELYLTVSSPSEGAAHSAQVFGTVGAFFCVYLARRSTRVGTRTSRPRRPGRVPSNPNTDTRRAAVEADRRAVELEEQFILAIGEMRQGNHVDAEAVLRRTNPRGASRMVASAREINRILQCMERGVSEANIVRLQHRIEAAWDAALAAGIPGALPELGLLSAAWQVDAMAPRIAAALGGPALAGRPASVRDALSNSLAELGQTGFDALLGRVIAVRTGDPAGTWLMDALIGMQPGRHSSKLVRFYAGCGKQGQDRLVSLLSSLCPQNAGTLFDILSGIHQSLPADTRLADELTKHLGREKLEREALRWVAGGHAGAESFFRNAHD